MNVSPKTSGWEGLLGGFLHHMCTLRRSLLQELGVTDLEPDLGWMIAGHSFLIEISNHRI